MNSKTQYFWAFCISGLLTPEQCRSKRQRKLLKQQQQQGSPQGSSSSPLNYPSSVKSEGGGGSNFDFNLGSSNSSNTGTSSSVTPSQGTSISGFSLSSSSHPNAIAIASSSTSNFGSLVDLNNLDSSRGSTYEHLAGAIVTQPQLNSRNLNPGQISLQQKNKSSSAMHPHCDASVAMESSVEAAATSNSSNINRLPRNNANNSSASADTNVALTNSAVSSAAGTSSNRFHSSSSSSGEAGAPMLANSVNNLSANSGHSTQVSAFNRQDSTNSTSKSAASTVGNGNYGASWAKENTTINLSFMEEDQANLIKRILHAKRTYSFPSSQDIQKVTVSHFINIFSFVSSRYSLPS